jgi:hypothetical protein
VVVFCLGLGYKFESMTIEVMRFLPPLKNADPDDLIDAVEAANTEVMPVGETEITPEGYGNKYYVRVWVDARGEQVGEVVAVKQKGNTVSGIDMKKGEVIVRPGKEFSHQINRSNPSMLLTAVFVNRSTRESYLQFDGMVFYTPSKK